MKWLLFSAFLFLLSVTNAQIYHFSHLTKDTHYGMYQNDSLSSFDIVISDTSIVCTTNRTTGGYIGDFFNESFVIISRNGNTITARNIGNNLSFVISVDVKELRIKTDPSIDQFEEYYFSN